MTRGAAAVLDRRTLNRTLLHRQRLLHRVDADPLEAIEHLVGLQAQEPPDPYVGLWSRIGSFDPLFVSRLIERREAVRIGLMRTTIHLVSTRDALSLAPVTDAVQRRVFRSTPFAKALDGVEVEAVLAEARGVLDGGPASPSDLGRHLQMRWPDRDRTALAALARYHLALVQVPPRGLWGRTGRTTNTLLETWSGERQRPAPVEDIVRRYLRAFGPATVSDMRTWSWLTGLRGVVDRMRSELVTYRDDRGRELLDVADGLIVSPDVAAPVRFLPQFDNVFLSHDDRSRIHGDTTGRASGVDFGWKGPILVDGFISGAWRVRRDPRRATMTIDLARALTPAERRDLDAEGDRLGTFLDPDRERETIVVPGNG